MNYGYDEILNGLVSDYESRTGEPLWKESETYKRFEAIASELFSLSCFASRNMQNSFVQTAVGNALDFHAALRGVERKPSNPSHGVLTFSVGESAIQDTEIPSGTICSVGNNPYLQFVTTEQGVIATGEISASVNAVSTENGSVYNVAPGEITVMVNAPLGISAVTNEAAFIGGKDEECDTHLRERIMSHYGNVQNGINASSLENLVMSLDFVRDCYIPDAVNAGIMRVYVATADDMLDGEQENEIISALKINEVIGANVQVNPASPKNFDLTVELHILEGFDSAEISQSVRAIVTDICNSSRIGRPIEFNTIYNALAKIDGVKRIELSSSKAVGNAVYCKAHKYLFLNDLAVEVIE